MATLSSGQVAVISSDLSNAIIERYMCKRVLRIAKKETIFYGLAPKQPIPEGESKTFTFQRFERIKPPRVSLTEGVTPAGQSMTVSKIPAVAEQWGAYITMTDVAQMTVRHQPWQKANELMGIQAAETLDREVQRVLLGGTNVYYPNGKTARSQLASGDIIDTALLRKIRAQLKNYGAPYYEGKKHLLICDPFNSQDIMNDITFKEMTTYQDKTPLLNGEFGQWMGFRCIESNHMPVMKRNDNIDSGVVVSDVGTGSGSLTDIANATYVVVVTGLDAQGFETQFQNGAHASAYSATCSSDVLQVVLPALPVDESIVAYNIYINDGAAGTTYYLNAENLGAGTYQFGTANGDNITTFNYSTTGRTAPVQPADNVNVHYIFFMGDEYFALGELEGIKVMMTPAGAQKGDELNQRRSVGWKFFNKAVITNQNFGGRIETESSFD